MSRTSASHSVIGDEIRSISWDSSLFFRLDRCFFGDDRSTESDIDLSSGTNLLRPPRCVLEAIAADADPGRMTVSDYCGPLGDPFLREAVLDFERTVQDSLLSDWQPAITVGGAEALRLAFAFLNSKGVTGSVVVGGWQHPLVQQAILASGLSLREVASSSPGRLLPPASELAEVQGPVVFVNCPHNPSGEQYDASDMGTLVSAAASRGQWVVIDKSGSDYGAHPTIQPFAYAKAIDASGHWDRTIVIDGPSKRRAISGLRMGYLLGSPELLRWVRIQRFGGCPPRVGMRGVAADLRTSARLASARASTAEQLNGVSVTFHATEVHEMYSAIAANELATAEILGSSLAWLSQRRAGFNGVAALKVSPRLAEPFSFGHSLFLADRVALFPVACFVADPTAAAPLLAQGGDMLVRFSYALDPASFSTALRRLAGFLASDAGR